ncbi:hypothetical protein A3F34_01535 [Candidatus Roizmanbacteria bacterium RIFCSPHIGHO2_12_FULL_44_10]|uniref:PIN domain-containing protein n=1 Tax=Candidatus Roizmanbacteria bacterium RIFCSPHIGHO2_12_FULL_44_10 TaxID=1802054 RepID=A0A1F7I691_9BACT|nr:MAG: hypothetical protein A3F34_01535 [Candidatus Roizmanbacteria bacterium RIFCSPHIGHO2_12_FULL_44_10]
MGKQVEGILDTNVILRYLVGDIPEQQKKAKSIFKAAEKGIIDLRVKVLVIAEACFVLESFYNKSREEIADSFQVFLSQKWLYVDDRKSLLSLWEQYEKGFHFVDSYIISWAQQNDGEIITFDKKLAKLSR